MIDLFQVHLEEIEKAIAAKRHHWYLSCLSYIDYDDVSQHIRLHINTKLKEEKWDSTRPFPQWVSTVVKNQINNLIRDQYGKVAPPCIRCPFNNDGNFCAFTKSKVKDDTCPAYKKWLKNKKSAHALKIACPIEDYDGCSHYTDFDIEKTSERFHLLMKEKLSPRLWEAYEYLHIKHFTDLQIVKKMGLTGKSVKGKVSGIRQLNNMKNKIFELAKELVMEIDFDY